jgi:hypothetical protein
MIFNFSILLFLIFTIIFIEINKNQKDKSLMSNTENSFFNFIKYLDRYYITNKAFTIFCVISYMLGNISIIFIIRFLYKNLTMDLNQIFIIENNSLFINYLNILSLFICGLVILFIIIFYRILLHTLFFDEIIKMHLFLNDNKRYKKLAEICKMFFIINFFGNFYLFFYNISKLRVITSLENGEEQDIDDYSEIYKNMTILTLSKICVNLAENFTIFLWVFTGLKKLFRLLYIYFRFKHGIITFIPYSIYFIVCFYDFVQLKIYYSIYGFIFLYSINLLFRVCEFLYNKDVVYDFHIAQYFYGNNSNYAEQRLIMKKNEIKFKFEFYKLDTNRQLSNNFDDLKIYIKNKFETNYYENDLDAKMRLKNKKAMYYRWLILFHFVIVYIYIIFNTNPYILSISILNIKISILSTYILLIFLGLTIYSSKKTYNYESSKQYDYHYSYYKVNKYYKYIFWILTIPQIIIYIIIIASNNIILNDNIIFDKYDMQLMKYYTIKEKINIFNMSYDYILKVFLTNNISNKYVNIFKLYREELNIRELITEDTTLKDIHNYLNDIKIRIETKIIIDMRVFLSIYNYYMEITIELMERLNIKEIQLKLIRFHMDFISNTINILALWKFTITYVAIAYQIINMPNQTMAKLAFFIAVKIYNAFKK